MGGHHRPERDGRPGEEEGRMTLKQRGGKHNEGRESPMKDRSASSPYTDVFVSLTSPMMLSVGDSELPPVLRA